MFSANLQETLGNRAYEGALVGAIMVPDRLSYTEMYDDDSAILVNGLKVLTVTQSTSPKLIEKLKNYMVYHNNYHNQLNTESAKLTANFFSGSKMYDPIKSDTPL